MTHLDYGQGDRVTVALFSTGKIQKYTVYSDEREPVERI